MKQKLNAHALGSKTGLITVCQPACDLDHLLQCTSGRHACATFLHAPAYSLSAVLGCLGGFRLQVMIWEGCCHKVLRAIIKLANELFH